MARETTFEHPPRGHVAFLAYDSANNRWQAVYADASGNLQVDVASIVAGDVQLYAWDGDSWEKVTIDASGHLQVDVAAAVDLNVQNLQYDGSAWRKSNLLWGFNDTIAEDLEDESLDVGTNDIDSTPVPEGEVHIIETIMGNTVSTTIDWIYLGVSVDGVMVWTRTISNPTTNTWYVTTGPFTLAKDDFVRMRVFTATALDDAYLRYCGYQMKVDM